MLATRRTFTSGFAAALLATAAAATEPPRGGTLNFLVEAEPPTLVTIAYRGRRTAHLPESDRGLADLRFRFQSSGRSRDIVVGQPRWARIRF
jgi:peptide/nickel transport system substrate-binding protein